MSLKKSEKGNKMVSREEVFLHRSSQAILKWQGKEQTQRTKTRAETKDEEQKQRAKTKSKDKEQRQRPKAKNKVHEQKMQEKLKQM